MTSLSLYDSAKTKQNDNDESSNDKINNNDKNQCLYSTYPNRFYVALRPVE